MVSGSGPLEALLSGGKPALARLLARLEADFDKPDLIAVLDACWQAPRGHVLGLTGPPGVGKSTLISGLTEGWRRDGLSVGIIAVDPSSRSSGGALLGDRTRIVTDPEDPGVFVRSMAARDRLGGLAGLTFPAMVVMRAVFDRVIVETVGIGQSETEIADQADTVLLCVQPGSGDALQFMKAGIMEVPDIVAVTKADMGPIAERAQMDVEGALSLVTPAGGWQVPVAAVSSMRRETIAALLAMIAQREAWLGEGGGQRLIRQRTEQGEAWVVQSIRERFGRQGLAHALQHMTEHFSGPQSAQTVSPFGREAQIAARLSGLLAGPA